MIRLDATNRSLEVKLGGAAATTEPTVTVCYSLKNPNSDTYVGAPDFTQTTGATAIALVAGPGGVSILDIDYLSMPNLDTAAITATLQINDNTVIRPLFKVLMAIGDCVIYPHAHGGAVLDSNGNLKSAAGGITGIAGGGTGQATATLAFNALAPTTTQGDTIHHNGTNNVRLAKGTALQVYRMNAGATAPEWGTGGGVVFDDETYWMGV